MTPTLDGVVAPLGFEGIEVEMLVWLWKKRITEVRDSGGGDGGGGDWI